MEKICGIIIILLFLFCINVYSGYSDVIPNTLTSKAVVVKTYDLNKDGKPDVTYYGDGQYVTKVEADTNYDGKPDVIVHTKNGKFDSAEVDSNYDGKVDMKFTDAAAFDKWLNANHPDFKDKLEKTDWRVNLKQF